MIAFITPSAMLPFPEINASLNALSTFLLTLGFIAIKAGKRKIHQSCMVSALVVSALFLVSYLTYHAQTGARTPFNGEGLWRMVYYPMLVTHIFLAAIIVPLVLRTFLFALKGNFEKHKKWALFTFPLWYYVSVTGILIYFFLYQWF